MILGKKEHFTREHFEKQRGYAPARLAELVVHCFELLSQVASSGIGIRFKGGNSLLLLLDEVQRFSVDIDVDTTESKESLISALTGVQKQCELFTRLEIRQHRTKPWLPMISFNVFFRSLYRAEEESFVMFDAVLKESPCAGEKKRIFIKGLYESDREVEVNPPAVLISDKLLTIGPSTLGIPMGKGKEAQRLKHIFDIARLARTGPDRGMILPALKKYWEQEKEIQRKECTLSEVAEDSLRFCEAVLPYEKQPDPSRLDPGEYIFEIAKGFGEFREHLLRPDYTWDLFRQDMSAVRDLVLSLSLGRER